MRRLVIATSLIALVVACGAPAPRPVVKGAPAPSAQPATALAPRACTPWVAPPEPPAPPPEDADALPDRRMKPEKAGDLCAVAESNLVAAEKHVLADPGGAVTPRKAWDHKAKPANYDRVAQRLTLTKAEHDGLAKNGFVVLAKRPFTTYAWALHEIYQSELPVWISADAVLHAVYASNDKLLADIERETLVPLLGKTLGAMHCALPDAPFPLEIARDLDVYLTVARSLLADKAIPSVLGVDDEAGRIVSLAKKAEGLSVLPIFGRDHLVDWSAYLPRGHYATAEADPDTGAEPEPVDSLTPYFRSAMWLSRMEMNVVSRSSRSSMQGAPDPHETPREAIVALALADLVDRAKVVPDVTRLDHAWALLAGRREDISVADMLALKRKANIGAIELGAFDKLKAAVGSDFQRTARTHPMPEGSTVLPAIATFLGPRVVADAAAFRPLVHTEVGQRYMVRAGDVAYVLGLDRGKTYLASDLATHPDLAKQLEVARGTLGKAPDAGDLYGAWLGALRGVAKKPSGALPSFMDGAAYDDLRMNTLVAGYAQIRHNYVLMAAQSYDEGGCEIPDGYVEPLPAVYEGVTAYAERGARVMRELDPKDALGAVKYFADLEKVSRVLTTIARHEVEGRALTVDEKRFLGMVVEMTPGSTGSSPTYTGWYFDMFRGRWQEALGTADLVADYHTSAWTQKVAYVGAGEPRLGVFVVDAGGAPRLAVGPVAHAYEAESGLDKRWTDTSAREAPASEKKEPWAASYTASATAEPAIAVGLDIPWEEGKPLRLMMKAERATKDVVLELLDHHRRPILTTTRSVPAKKVLRFTLRAPRTVEGIRVRVGAATIEGFTHGPEPSVNLASGGVSLETDDWIEPGK